MKILEPSAFFDRFGPPHTWKPMSKITEDQLLEVLSRHPGYDCNIYVETGLHEGDRLRALAPIFRYCEGIELDPHWATHCRERMADLGAVRVHEGDTLELLPRILASRPRCPHYVHLDAHFCQTVPPILLSEFPLWGELAILARERRPIIVSVCDVHTFGRNRPDVPGNPWEGVTVESILGFLGDGVLDSEIIGDAFYIWLVPMT